MADARTKRTNRAIKDALLELLKQDSLSEIGMAELAKKAGISRSTLYSHYGNVMDVFVALVEEFAESVRSLNVQLKCDTCQALGHKRPFCMALRAAGPYQSLVLAPEFLRVFLNFSLENPNLCDALKPYLDTGLSEQQARSLYVFQITGCYTAATTLDSMLWKDNQEVIDQFIRGGLSALRQAHR